MLVRLLCKDQLVPSVVFSEMLDPVAECDTHSPIKLSYYSSDSVPGPNYPNDREMELLEKETMIIANDLQLSKMMKQIEDMKKLLAVM